MDSNHRFPARIKHKDGARRRGSAYSGQRADLFAPRSSLARQTHRWRELDSYSRSPVRVNVSMKPGRRRSAYPAHSWLQDALAETDTRTLVRVREAPGGSRPFAARPFCELGPASTDQVLGVIGRHFDGAVRADIDGPTREGIHGPHAGWGKQANPIS